LEINLHADEHFFEAKAEIINEGELCNMIILIAHGTVEVQMTDKHGDVHVIDTLKRGSIIGQYSVFCNEQSIFTMTAKTSVRLLTLEKQFFIDNKEKIDGLEYCIFQIE